MKRLLMVLVVGLVMFGASAGVSIFLRDKSAVQPGHGPDHVEKGVKGLPASLPAGTKEPGAKGTSLPSRILSQPTPEGLAQLATSLRQQQEALRAREEALLTRQKHLDLIHADLKSERDSLDELRKQITAELKGLQEKMEQVDRKTADLGKQGLRISEQNKELKLTMFEMDNVEQKRIKQMAAMYDSMDPETAGDILQQMADTGKMEMAVKILATMQERSAARLLAQMQDKGTVVQMLDKLKALKKTGP